MVSISFTVNRRSVAITADGDAPLLDVLRNHLGLTGTRFGCGLEQCGACMVLIDGVAEKSCGVALSTVAGKCVLTIEGLGRQPVRTRYSRLLSMNRPANAAIVSPAY